MQSKYYLLIINIILLLSSLGIFIVGGIVKSDLNANYSLFREHVNNPLAFLITFGVGLCLAVLITFISVYRQNHVMLSLYIFVMALLVVIELSVGIAIFVTKSRVLSLITQSLRSAESVYSSDHVAALAWDSVQRGWRCCGLYRHDEWFRYLGRSSLPRSCCVRYSSGCGNDAVQTGNFYQTGCASALSQWAHKAEITTAVLTTFLMSLQLLSLPLARRYQRILH